ncbi:MAG: 2-C-methyl-D-erythritol 4-phosphate cytidylyltransferase [Planctomycetaceae bacterium]|nr:2-C-methyl-D-erythritol 4-phosphate cytidylyltransferase [Planctomycetaceae bacterium]
MAKFAVILPAAGKSSRFSNQVKKVFTELKGRAIWVRSAELFVNRPDVIQTLVVIAEEDRDWFKEKFAPNLAFMNVQIIIGGKERFDSVRKALEQVSPEADYVAVHDAARPLMVPDWVDAVFKAAEKTGAAIPAVPVTSTLKRVGSDNRIEKTVSRDHLWMAQTPQVAKREWLVDAYEKIGSLNPTDEAQLLEQAGYSVEIVEGSPLNLKITTKSDLRLAEVSLDALPKPKIPRALHPFADENPFGAL